VCVHAKPQQCELRNVQKDEYSMRHFVDEHSHDFRLPPWCK